MRPEGVGVDTMKRIGFLGWDVGAGSLVGLLAGTASAGFLWLLDHVIHLREQHLWLLLLLPFFGVLSAWLYQRFGAAAEGGNRLVMDEVIDFQGRVPSRMAPLVLVGTLLSHLGGASVGREGTAVQMGASLARSLGKLQQTCWGAWLGLNDSRQRLLLMAGVSGGFGSLFGTPVAGAMFGLEVISIGKLHYEGLVICTAAGFVGDWVCRWLGAPHARYLVPAEPWTALLGLKLLLFGLPVALVAGGFSEASQGLARWVRARVANPLLRPFLGGLAILGLVALFRRTDFLNLGTVWFPAVLAGTGPVPTWAFAAKFLFTVVALGFGFKGGEVTPLFAIGALLGAACAPLLGLPPAYLGALGFAAVFATASNTPVAALLLGTELFGAGFLAPLALLCFPAYILVGHRGIYGASRVHTSKALLD